MTLFWLGAAVMVLAALGWMLPAFWSRDAVQQPTRDDHVIQAYEDRLAELEADFDEGIIDGDQLATARDELAAELVADVREDHKPVRASAAPVSAAIAGMVVIGTSIALIRPTSAPARVAYVIRLPTHAGPSVHSASIALIRPTSRVACSIRLLLNATPQRCSPTETMA